MEIKPVMISGENIDTITVDYYPETDSVRVFIHTKTGTLKKISEMIGKKIDIIKDEQHVRNVEVMSFTRSEGVSIF